MKNLPEEEALYVTGYDIITLKSRVQRLTYFEYNDLTYLLIFSQEKLIISGCCKLLEALQ